MHNRVKIAKSLKTLRFKDLEEIGGLVTPDTVTKSYEFEKDGMVYTLHATKHLQRPIEVMLPQLPQDEECPIIPVEDILELDDGNGDDWVDTQEDDEDDCHPAPPCHDDEDESEDWDY
jgi:hypothetical protein